MQEVPNDIKNVLQNVPLLFIFFFLMRTILLLCFFLFLLLFCLYCSGTIWYFYGHGKIWSLFCRWCRKGQFIMLFFTSNLPSNLSFCNLVFSSFPDWLPFLLRLSRTLNTDVCERPDELGILRCCRWGIFLSIVHCKSI